MHFQVFLLAQLATGILSASVPKTTDYDSLSEHEIAHIPYGWSKVSDARDEEVLNLKIALQHPNSDYLAVASAVSDPDSSRYGQYLSAKELRSILPDIKETSHAVEEWLHLNEITDILRTHDLLSFSTTVSRARTLLKANFSVYAFERHTTVLRTESYSVPTALSDKIDFIYPTTQFLNSWSKKSDPHGLESRQHIPTPPNCVDDTCPQLLVDKYNIDYFPANSSSGSKLGVAGFLEEYPSTEDLKSFLKNHSPGNRTSDLNFSTETVNGGLNPDTLANATVEAMLDLQYTAVFTGPLPLIYYSVGGRPPTINPNGSTATKSSNEPYLEFLNYLLAQDSPPQVLSISYSDDEQTVPPPYANKVCNLFAQLATRGTSVIIASGDGGAAGVSRGDCIGPDGKWIFKPTFPASCPWVTSVGAIAPYGGSSSFSSGGFSNYFGRPDYQDQDIPPSIALLNGSHAGFYNASGRGIPDVSLLGDRYVVGLSGYLTRQNGASCSTPVFASMITLINDLRLRAGKPVLGFLNPLLYKKEYRDIFTDVTLGSSTGCANSTTFEGGWNAQVGWDAATGKGSVDFEKLRKHFT